MRRISAHACIILMIMTVFGCSASGPVDNKSSGPASVHRPPVKKDFDRFLAADEQHLDPNTPITLRQSLALALLGNPELEAFSWQLRAQEANILQKSLRPNPVLGAKVENFGGTDPMNSASVSLLSLVAKGSSALVWPRQIMRCRPGITKPNAWRS